MKRIKENYINEFPINCVAKKYIKMFGLALADIIDQDEQTKNKYDLSESCRILFDGAPFEIVEGNRNGLFYYVVRIRCIFQSVYFRSDLVAVDEYNVLVFD